jgi:hypothetical protein
MSSASPLLASMSSRFLTLSLPVAALLAFPASSAAAESVLGTNAPASEGAATSDLAASNATGFEVGLRLAAELPLGNVDSNLKQADSLHVRSSSALRRSVSFGVPLVLDIGARVSPRTFIGASFTAGTGKFGKGCPDDTSCSWAEFRVGVTGIYQFSEGPRVPWIGIGLGWEWLRLWNLSTVTVEDPDKERQAAVLTGSRELLGGPQLSLLGGLDFVVDNALKIGPYAALSGGTYLTSHQLCRGVAQCETNTGVESPAVHAWLALGVRGSYGP